MGSQVFFSRSRRKSATCPILRHRKYDFRWRRVQRLRRTSPAFNAAKGAGLGTPERPRVQRRLDDGAVLQPTHRSRIQRRGSTESSITARVGPIAGRSNDVKTEMETFDGLDNRREVIILLQRLGSNDRRARFIESLIPSSLKGFAGCPMKVTGNCEPVAAYYMLVGVCNELGVSLNSAAWKLEEEVKRGISHS